MRKLSKAQVATLVVGAVIGLNSVYANEPGQIDEIVVTAQRPPLITITINITIQLSTSQAFLQSNGTVQVPNYTAGAHAWACAQAYGGATPGASPGTPGATAGPNPGNIDTGPWQTYFSNNYGWGNTNLNTQPAAYFAMTSGVNPPAGTGVSWSRIDGYTSGAVLGNPYVGGYTVVFVPTAFVAKGGYSATANLVDTLAHEWAHQWGATDASGANPSYNANTIGDAARNAYLADKGAKCGGL